MANLWRAPDFDPTARERRGKQLDSIKFDEDLLASLQAPRLAKEAEASRVASAQAAEASAQAAAVTKSVAGSGTVSGLSLREPPPIGEEEQKLNAEVRSSLKPLTNREAIREGRAYVPGSPMMPGPERSDLTKAVSQARAAINETRPSYTQQKTGAELLNMDPNRKLGSIDEAIKLDAFHGAASQLMGDTFESRQAAARGAGLQYGASITAGNIGGTIGDKNAASLTQTVSGKYGSGFSTAPLVPTMKQSLGGSIASAAPKPTRLQKEGAAADADARAKFDQPFTLGSDVGGLTLSAGTPTLAAETAAGATAAAAAKPAATAAATGSSLPALPTVPGQLAAPAQATAPNAAPTVATTPLRQKTALDIAFPNSPLSLQLRPAAQTAAPNAAPNSMEGREYAGMSAGAAQAAVQETLGKNGKKGVPKFTTTAASESIFDLSNIDTRGIPSIQRASSGLTASIQGRLSQITPVDHEAGTDIPYFIAGVKETIDPKDPARSLQQIAHKVKRTADPTAIRDYLALVNFLAPAKA